MVQPLVERISLPLKQISRVSKLFLASFNIHKSVDESLDISFKLILYEMHRKLRNNHPIQKA